MGADVLAKLQRAFWVAGRYLSKNPSIPSRSRSTILGDEGLTPFLLGLSNIPSELEQLHFQNCGAEK